jgi:hypothetical protein
MHFAIIFSGKSPPDSNYITQTEVRHTSAAVLFVVGVLLPCLTFGTGTLET